MAFIDFPSPTPVFPDLPPKAWSVHKEPSFKTSTSTAISGREYQIVRQVIPRWLFTLSYGGESWLRDQTQNITPYGPLTGYTELEQMAGLFLGCLGAYGEFYYEDPDDNSRVGEIINNATLGVLSYGIFFSWGTGPFTSGMQYPVTGIKTLDAVYLNGVLESAATYSLDATRTQLVFVSQPTVGDAISVDFHFYFRCRFMNDVEEFEEWAWNLWEKKSLKFQSVKP